MREIAWGIKGAIVYVTNEEIIYATLHCVPVGCEITSPLRLAYGDLSIECVKDNDGKCNHPGGWPWAQRIGKPWQRDLEAIVTGFHYGSIVGAGL